MGGGRIWKGGADRTYCRELEGGEGVAMRMKEEPGLKMAPMVWT